MNDKIAQAATSTKNFLNRHKVALAAAAGLTLGLALNKWNMNQVDEFLKEHGLYEEYWASEEE